MATNAENNKRIAKNTLFLYARMILIMIVTLYTSRVVLNALGIEDFGIYNVVGGIIAMLSFFNSSMSIATQRFLNYEMGRKRDGMLAEIFSNSFISYCAFAVVAVILAETIGLWFVINKLVIPPSRLTAAIYVYQFSILTFVVNLLSVPYNAAIIAHEKMSAFAYISILEALGKLLIAYLVVISPIDNLILYGLLMFLIALAIRSVYSIYCKRNFLECKVRWRLNKDILKQLFGFSGWMLAGTISHLFNTQAINILVNIYFGPALNASRAISVQVYNAINSFAVNFMMATRPQVVKSYAQKKMDYVYKLTFSSSKLSYILLVLLSLPILLETDYVLKLWLKNVPEYTSLFVKLSLIDLLVISAFSPIASLSQASGKIKNYQLIISIGFLSIFLITWLAYFVGFPVYSTFIISIFFNILGLVARIYELKISQNFPFGSYIKKVFVPICLSFMLIVCGGWAIHVYVLSASSIMSLLSCVGIYLLWGTIISWCVVLNKEEKIIAKNIIYKVFSQNLCKH